MLHVYINILVYVRLLLFIVWLGNAPLVRMMITTTGLATRL